MLDGGAHVRDDDIVVAGDQLGAGYGIPTEAMIDTVRLVARTQGVLLDPVYSGKAFAGLVAMLPAGQVPTGSSVLFVATGGVPGLHAYRSVFDTD